MFRRPSSVHGDHSKTYPGLSVLVPISVAITLISCFEDSNEALAFCGSLPVHPPQGFWRSEGSLSWNLSPVLNSVDNTLSFEEGMIFR